ncbi:MAG: hypothetical protein ABI472_18050 [Ginsengibacter sp.]
MIINSNRGRYLLSTVAYTVLFPFSMQAQQTKPQLLKESANWAFERFTLPPSFAPAFSYKGAEELRFSPGMFNKNAIDYFTYAFVAQLDSVTGLSREDIKNYLLDYFKGLCSSTAHDRKLVIDISALTVDLRRKNNTTGDEIIYNALLNIFGVFADGAPVKLRMEVKVLTDTVSAKTYLVFIASPHEKTNEAWKELYQVQKDFTFPENNE